MRDLVRRDRSRPHLYDEEYEPAFEPWLTFVPLAASRASTVLIDQGLLSELLAATVDNVNR